MNSIRVDLENCYGIGKLKEVFDLKSSNGCVIYSQNGTMKTSFANTFDDVANKRKPKDRIYPNRYTKCTILKDDNSEIESDEIFVIKSYDESRRFSQYKDTSLLVNEELRQKYLKVHNDIDEKKKILLKKLTKKSGIRKNIEEDMIEAFNKEILSNYRRDKNKNKRF